MDFIKENLLTIVLVFLIIIVFVISGIFVYKILTKNNENDDFRISEIKEIIVNDNTYETEEILTNNTKNEENIINVEKSDNRLIQIANIFNSSNAAEEMRLRGYTMNATTIQNGISVLSSGDGLTFNIQFILDNNILSTKIIYSEINPQISAIELMLALILIDSVGQMQGLPERTLTNILSNEAAKNYTIENEGVEIKQLDNNQGISIKVDLESDLSSI